jgi:hypothetical protein
LRRNPTIASRSANTDRSAGTGIVIVSIIDDREGGRGSPLASVGLRFANPTYGLIETAKGASQLANGGMLPPTNAKLLTRLVRMRNSR